MCSQTHTVSECPQNARHCASKNFDPLCCRSLSEGDTVLSRSLLLTYLPKAAQLADRTSRLVEDGVYNDYCSQRSQAFWSSLIFLRTEMVPLAKLKHARLPA